MKFLALTLIILVTLVVMQSEAKSVCSRNIHVSSLLRSYWFPVPGESDFVQVYGNARSLEDGLGPQRHMRKSIMQIPALACWGVGLEERDLANVRTYGYLVLIVTESLREAQGLPPLTNRDRISF